MAVGFSSTGTVLEEVPFPDQIGSALSEFPKAENRQLSEQPSSNHREVFDALLYLARGRDYDHLLAFYLLHQVYAALSRHERDEDWPTLDEMWLTAKARAAQSRT